jgi:hypothetical protein
MRRGIIVTAAIAMAILIGVAIAYVRQMMNRGFQINTSVRMIAICDAIERDTRRLDAATASARAQKIVLEHYGGLDAWHRPLLFVSRLEQGRFSYILVSVGSDGKIDRPAEQYFSLSRSDIRGLAERDIVFRNGQWVTNAMK